MKWDGGRRSVKHQVSKKEKKESITNENRSIIHLSCLLTGNRVVNEIMSLLLWRNDAPRNLIGTCVLPDPHKVNSD